MLVLTSVISGGNLKLCVQTDEDLPLRNLVKSCLPILESNHDPKKLLVQEKTKAFEKYWPATKAALHSFSVFL
jgi:hypothetical protein